MSAIIEFRKKEVKPKLTVEAEFGLLIEEFKEASKAFRKFAKKYQHYIGRIQK